MQITTRIFIVPLKKFMVIRLFGETKRSKGKYQTREKSFETKENHVSFVLGTKRIVSLLCLSSMLEWNSADFSWLTSKRVPTGVFRKLFLFWSSGELIFT